MTQVRPASRGHAWLWVIVISSYGVPAHGEEPQALLLLREPRAQGAESRLKPSALRERREPEAWVLERGLPGVAAERLARLQQVEALLLQAREQTAGLQEAEALATLGAAVFAVEQLADVPGCAAWNAEVQLQLAVTAAQAGVEPLAAQAYARAALLDPGRRLLEGEAPPAQVQRFARVLEEVATRTAAEVELSVQPRGASVYVDDRLLGRAPVRLRAAAGRHLLRVEAAGYAPYGAPLDLFEGKRLPMAIALAPAPALVAARALARAAAAGDYAAVVAELRALHAETLRGPAVDVLETTPGSARALLVRCTRDGCASPARLGARDEHAPVPEGRLSLAGLERDRRWVALGHTSTPQHEDRPFWRLWYVWGGAAAVTLAVATAVIVAARSKSDSRLRVVVEPGDVGQ